MTRQVSASDDGRQKRQKNEKHLIAEVLADPENNFAISLGELALENRD